MKWKNWKTMFFILLGINLFIVLLLCITVLSPGSNHNINIQNNEYEGYVPFLIQSEKENLTEVINHYIEKEASGGPIEYFVKLEQEVELYGSITVFGEEIQMVMTFEPKALENGDLILQQDSISIGKMQLPVSYVLKFIEERYKLPKGVIISPSEKLIYISLQDLKLKSDFKVKVEEFNLKTNDISFQLFVPIN
jgi:uncharacterized protein YpmS